MKKYASVWAVGLDKTSVPPRDSSGSVTLSGGYLREGSQFPGLGDTPEKSDMKHAQFSSRFGEENLYTL